MFPNRIAAAFAIDLLFVALVACIWFYSEGRRLGMRRVWIYWVLTLAFGLAGTLPHPTCGMTQTALAAFIN